MASKVYTAQEMRKMADKEEFKCSFVTRTLNGGIILDRTRDVRAMLLQAADAMDREEKRFIIRSNDDGSFWVSPHRWLKGLCAKATIFSSAFYAKKAVEFENKSKSGRDQLPQVYEIMEDGRLRFVSEEECAK